MPRYPRGVDNPQYGRDYYSSSHQRDRGVSSAANYNIYEHPAYTGGPEQTYASYGVDGYHYGYTGGQSSGGHRDAYPGVGQSSNQYIMGTHSSRIQPSSGNRHSRKQTVAVTKSSKHVHNTVGDYSYRDTKAYHSGNPNYPAGYGHGQYGHRDEYGYPESSSSTCGSPICIAIAVIVIIAILAAIIVPTLYFTVLKKDDSSSGESVEIQGSVRLEDGFYTSGLSNPFSSAFKAKEEEFCSATESAMRSRGTLGKKQDCEVTSFEAGSLVINFILIAVYDTEKAPTEAELEEYFDIAVRTASVSNGNFFNSGGLDEIDFGDGQKTTTPATPDPSTTTTTTTTTAKPTIAITTTKKPAITTTKKPPVFTLSTKSTTITTKPPTTSKATTKKPTTKAPTGPTEPTTTQAPCIIEKSLQLTTEKVTITSPDYPNKYPNNKECTYNINGKAGFGLFLTIDKFELEEDDYCEYDSVSYLDDSGNEIRDVMCGDRTGESLVLDVTYVQLVFSSDVDTNAAGFSIDIVLKDLTDYCGGDITVVNTDSWLQSPEYDTSYPNDLDCVWTMTAPTGEKIIAEITGIDIEADDSCAYDYLKIDESDLSHSHGTFCGESFEAWPMISYTNKLKVTFSSDVSINGKGFRLKYRALACGGHTDFPGTVTSPGSPNYANDLSCSWLIHSDSDAPMTLTMVSIDIHPTTGACGGDTLKITERISASEQNIIGTYCGQGPEALGPTEGRTLLVEFVTDGSNVGQGFELSYDTLDLTCGETRTITAGQKVSLTSPLYPANYPNGAECTWKITGPAGSNLQLSFDIDLHIEGGSGCPYDRLEMRNGGTSSSPINAVLCGLLTPRTLITDGNQMYLKFTSDSSDNEAGFDITVEVGTGAPTSGACPATPNTNTPDNSGVKCGEPAISPILQQAKIIRGTEARPNSWPWQIMIQERADAPSCSFNFLCGGSIIHDRWILTAAHCIESDDPLDYRVIVGKHSRKAEGDHRYEVINQVAEYYVHEGYDSNTFDNDVALLKLQDTIEFTDQVSPVCVTNTPAPDNQDCYATGWGDTKGTGDDQVLQQALLPTINRAQCMTNPGMDDLTENMFCAGYEINLRDTCQGDSGGPFVCKLSGKPWALFGAVSWGYGCGAENAPGVYAEVAKYVAWIADKTDGDVDVRP